MSNVTYLFGAGASALALPTVPDIPLRLIKFRKALKNGEGMGEGHRANRDFIVDKITSVLREIIDLDHYEKANEVVFKHASIDTYAKKLFIHGRDDAKLDELKLIMSLFFLFEQHIKRVDMRYDSFFASIIRDSSKRLPQLVNIVSWNYDLQFEIAFKEFTGKSVKAAHSHLKVMTKGFPTGYYMPAKSNEFGIFKINGSAAFFNKATPGIVPYMDEKGIENICDRSCKIYQDYVDHKTYNALSFSWEDKDHRLLTQLKEATSATDVLVLIGYSIPFFNREVDKEIVTGMPLTRVYIQDLNPDPVKERFESILGGVDIVVNRNVDQFLLPNELSL